MKIDEAEFMIQLLYMDYNSKTCVQSKLIREEIDVYKKHGYRIEYFIENNTYNYKPIKRQIGFKYETKG